MKLVKYTLCDIELVMVDIEGVLYCSTPQLEKIFGANKGNLSTVVRRYPEEFTNTRVGALGFAINNLTEFKEAMMFSRLRDDARLWSEDDVIGLTWLWRSDIARQCRAQFKEILKQHARRDSMPMNQVEAMVADFKAQIAPLQEAVEELMSERKKMASHVGRALRIVRN